MSEGSSFGCNVSGREYDINSDFNCDSSGVVYLLGYKVCGKQCVGSPFTSFRARFNKSSSRKFSRGLQWCRQSVLDFLQKPAIMDF